MQPYDVLGGESLGFLTYKKPLKPWAHSHDLPDRLFILTSTPDTRGIDAPRTSQGRPVGHGMTLIHDEGGEGGYPGWYPGSANRTLPPDPTLTLRPSGPLNSPGGAPPLPETPFPRTLASTPTLIGPPRTPAGCELGPRDPERREVQPDAQQPHPGPCRTEPPPGGGQGRGALGGLATDDWCPGMVFLVSGVTPGTSISRHKS